MTVIQIVDSVPVKTYQDYTYSAYSNIYIYQWIGYDCKNWIVNKLEQFEIFNLEMSLSIATVVKNISIAKNLFFWGSKIFQTYQF